MYTRIQCDNEHATQLADVGDMTCYKQEMILRCHLVTVSYALLDLPIGWFTMLDLVWKR